METKFRLRDRETGFYIHAVHGVVSWVAHTDHAKEFPKRCGWRQTLEKTTGRELDAMEACLSQEVAVGE